jgi:ammonia channel protein AmtB
VRGVCDTTTRTRVTNVGLRAQIVGVVCVIAWSAVMTVLIVLAMKVRVRACGVIDVCDVACDAS